MEYMLSTNSFSAI